MTNQKVDGSLGFLLNRSSLVFQKKLNRNFTANGLNITIEQWSILVYLFNFNGKSQNEIADDTFKDKVSVNKVVNTLEKNKLVERILDKKDARIRRIFLTKNAEDLIPKLRNIVHLTLKQAFKGLGTKDIDTFKFVLASIAHNLDDIDLLNFIKINKGMWK